MLHGLVGRTILKVLEEKNFSNFEYVLFASSRSAGSKLPLFNKMHTVYELREDSFYSGFHFAIFSAGSNISKKFAPIAVNNGCVVIDNSNAFRMNCDVPLIVPEVNSEEIFNHHGIIANPNCSTIQAVVVLKPLDEKYSIKRIVYSTYQAVSGAGQLGIDDYNNSLKNISPKKFPYAIANNCIPHIDDFLNNGYSKEEIKMIEETRKILKKPKLNITATAVRVPVLNCHSEAINIEFEKDFLLSELKSLLQSSPGIIVQDDIFHNIYPLASNACGKDNVFVGRIRCDNSIPHGINLWVVADNLRKGAASNAVQILEKLIN